MELKIQTEISLPNRIDFNYTELKNELSARLQTYSGKEKTDITNYKERKADRAKLNALERTLNDSRNNIKNQLLAPMTEGSPDNMSFSDKIDDLIGMVKMVVGEIDNGIKEYEESEKSRKREDIMAFFRSHWTDAFSECGTVILNSRHWTDFAEEQINRRKNSWLNSTCDAESIREEIRTEVRRCVQAYMLINEMYKDDDELTRTKAFDALSVNFDTQATITIVNDHKRQSKLSAEVEERKRTEEEESMAKKVVLSEPINPSSGAEPEIYSCTMKFVGSVEAFRNLKEYLSMNKDITYTIVCPMSKV